MLRLLRRPLNLPPDRLLEIHLPRHNHRREPGAPGSRFPDRSERPAELGEPFALGHAAPGWHLRRRGVDAGFGEQGDVLVLLVGHGPVGVSEADTDFGFALVQQVPVVEGGHGARGGDAEGLAVGR